MVWEWQQKRRCWQDKGDQLTLVTLKGCKCVKGLRCTGGRPEWVWCQRRPQIKAMSNHACVMVRVASCNFTFLPVRSVSSPCLCQECGAPVYLLWCLACGSMREARVRQEGWWVCSWVRTCNSGAHKTRRNMSETWTFVLLAFTNDGNSSSFIYWFDSECYFYNCTLKFSHFKWRDSQPMKSDTWGGKKSTVAFLNVFSALFSDSTFPTSDRSHGDRSRRLHPAPGTGAAQVSWCM